MTAGAFELTARLSGQGLTAGYGPAAVFRGVDIEVGPGVTTIIGPNGSGKSTLLRTLARLHRPSAGAVYLDGRLIQAMPAKQVARRLGLLGQLNQAPDGITVEQLARQGRYPHRSFLSPFTRRDQAAVDRALELAGVADLRDRPVDALSGGQRQRAWLAMALAQEPAILLLDEPTTFLDIHHQHELLRLIRELADREGRAIVLVLHDVNDAAAVSDRVIALAKGAVAADGPPEEVCTAATLDRLYGIPFDVHPHPATGRPIAAPLGLTRTARPAAAGAGLAANAVTLGYGRSAVIEDLSAEIPEGRLTAIIGPNACGKSTLFRGFARTLPPRRGDFYLRGRRVSEAASAELARELSVLPQHVTPPAGLTVEQVVAAGRYPHQRWYRQWSREDGAAVQRAIDATGLAGLAGLPFDALSGGQRQRVLVAMALAREAPVLLLDEPTTYLDIGHQVALLELLARANETSGVTVVAILHDLELARRWADHVIAMKAGRIVAAGPPAEVVTPAVVEAVFGVALQRLHHPAALAGAALHLPPAAAP